MPIKYKIDVIDALKTKGYTTYKIRKEKLISEGALTSLRNSMPISFENLGKLCELLDCNVEDIIYYEQDAGVLKTEEVAENVD